MHKRLGAKQSSMTFNSESKTIFLKHLEHMVNL